MFALVRYDNEKYYVVPKEQVLYDKIKCVVKSKGCRYEATPIAFNCK